MPESWDTGRMRYVVWVSVVVAAILGVRELLRAAGRKGWIYYGDINRPRFSVGNALSMFQPEIEHVIEHEQRGYVEDVDDEAAEPGPEAE